MLDWSVFDQYYDLLGDEGDEFVAEIIESFLLNAPPILQDIKEALKSQDAEILTRSAHTLKTNCATVGALALADQFLSLENLGDQSDFEKAMGTVSQCQQDFHIVVGALREKHNSLQS